jgi:uncharacterized NAD(P)/FAD-binding protein YdhS
MPERRSIAIIGGGCSGALAAVHLLRSQSPVRVHLIESRRVAGTGLAYSTDCPHHLLNVPACGMSILPDAPKDFVEWLERDSGAPADPHAFVPRAVFGRYIGDSLEAACREARPHSVLVHHCAQALDIQRDDERSIVHLSDGNRLEANSVVLALGNPAPRHLSFLPRATTGWESNDPDAPVALIGSGLSAVDAFVELRANGHRGVVHMISRRGLLPQAHVSNYKPGSLSLRWKSGTLRELVREFRARVQWAEQEGLDWRDVMASLRGVTNDLWLNLSPRDRERFYRHLKAYWDTHRHRMAPQIAAIIQEARRNRTLRVHAARVQRMVPVADSLEIDMRLRSGQRAQLSVERAINCTGSEQDYRRVDSPLLRSLFGNGWLAPNGLELGVRTEENGAVIGRDGAVVEWLYALGPMRIGGLLETTAVPEIRVQAAALAGTLLAARSAVAA